MGRWKCPGGRPGHIPLSVDLAIIVSCDVTVGVWDRESSSLSIGSGPASSGLELDILK